VSPSRCSALPRCKVCCLGRGGAFTLWRTNISLRALAKLSSCASRSWITGFRFSTMNSSPLSRLRPSHRSRFCSTAIDLSLRPITMSSSRAHESARTNCDHPPCPPSPLIAPESTGTSIHSAYSGCLSPLQISRRMRLASRVIRSMSRGLHSDVMRNLIEVVAQILPARSFSSGWVNERDLQRELRERYYYGRRTSVECRQC